MIQPDNAVIVLNYHELTDGPPADDWCLPSGLFEEHAALFGPRAISPAEFLKHCHDPARRRSGEVLLTFDDANLSDYASAFADYAGTGRIPGFMSFIPTNLVGQSGRMTWEMIAEMDRNGIVIGSHGLAHLDLTCVTDEVLGRELGGSKAVLEDKLGHEINLLAFPFGRFSRRVWEAALAAGYTHLFTIQLGRHQGFEPFLFSRLCVTNWMNADYMRRHLADPDAARGLGWRISSRLGLYRALMRRRFG